MHSNEEFKLFRRNSLSIYVSMQICIQFNRTVFTQFLNRNGYHFDTALLLSVFLGMFGIDRFYLGYYGIGLMKFCTLGFMFIGQLIDVVLIATQCVGPAGMLLWLLGTMFQNF